MSQAASPPRRVSLMGLSLDALEHHEVVARVGGALARGQGGWIITPNLDILRQARRMADGPSLFAAADLVLADGMPLVWASRMQGSPLPERVPGSDLVWSLCDRAAVVGASVFLLGGRAGTAERAGARLLDRFPGLNIAGTYSPRMGFDRDPAQVEAVLERVCQAGPRLVLVALGFPKQERLIARLRPLLQDAWFIGVGISLGFIAGDVRRAPHWMQVTGLEWIHRLVQEPGRLADRYLVRDIPFGVQLFADAARTRWRRPG